MAGGDSDTRRRIVCLRAREPARHYRQSLRAWYSCSGSGRSEVQISALVERKKYCFVVVVDQHFIALIQFGNGIPGCTARAPPRGIFCSSSGPLHIFHWNHRARGEGPRPRSQGRFGIAGIRTRTGSDVCSVVTNCATPAGRLIQLNQRKHTHHQARPKQSRSSSTIVPRQIVASLQVPV